MTTSDQLLNDYRSDTLTLPTDEMKAYMCQAELGDDVFGEDPTVAKLESVVADLTGHEAGLFMPTGSMGNLVAMMAHTQPGQVLYAGSNSHVKLYELGSYARIAGLSLCEIDDSKGYLDSADLAAVWSPDIYYMSKPGMVCIENTHNMLGGLIYPQQQLADLAVFCRERKAPLHMDGARALHSARALKLPLSTWTRHVDSAMISLNKGLGAPAGSVLTASRDVVSKARTFRKLLGGGMRQAGVIAAAGLYGLEHHLPALDESHQRCRTIYEAVSKIPGLKAVEPDTNILIFYSDEPRAVEIMSFFEKGGVKLLALGPDKLRMVFHFNQSSQSTERVLELFNDWRSQL